MKNVKENGNAINNGDFESENNIQWMYSLTGSPIEVTDEIIEVKNKFVEIKTTESIFQRLNFKANDSGTIGLSVRGDLPVTVSVMEASAADPVVFWSEEVQGYNENWTPVTLQYTLGAELGPDLCLHIQAKWDQNAEATVDIDNVTLQSDAGTPLSNGDFESGGIQWIYSLTGSAIQTKDETVQRTNHFARFHQTESIFQRYTFKSNQSGSVRLQMRGELGVTVSIMEASSITPKVFWTGTVASGNGDWLEYMLRFNLGTVDGQDLCLHFQADYDQDQEKNLDIDNVFLTFN